MIFKILNWEIHIGHMLDNGRMYVNISTYKYCKLIK